MEREWEGGIFERKLAKSFIHLRCWDRAAFSQRRKRKKAEREFDVLRICEGMLNNLVRLSSTCTPARRE
jgi:hypothetical protein